MKYHFPCRVFVTTSLFAIAITVLAVRVTLAVDSRDNPPTTPKPDRPLVTISPRKPTLPSEITVTKKPRSTGSSNNRLTPTVRKNKPTGIPSQADKLKACQARQAAIKNRSAGLAEFVDHLLDTFSKITTRVQEYYATKGLTIPNYPALVSDITSQKIAAQAALTKAQAVMINFDCNSSGDPKTILETYNQETRNVHTALKSYKTAIRNLIVAVHTQKPSGQPTRKPTSIRPIKGGSQ